ncbi:Rieske (2Fe-2S) protein [Streptacidiphilus carbonis]|jgi:Rieske Fe-S protein|uniref:Rieske (2Fe-2S) protein n=1 Tax=Streptacidiphilus carbonis TaxID=105422 RepID=UPI0005AB5D73|nr:Rieske (2Fe-2S) protein [Streptacidiphilus carbonis]
MAEESTKTSTARRTVLAGVGVVGAAGVLAACGSSSSGGSASAAGGASTPAADPTTAAAGGATSSAPAAGGGGSSSAAGGSGGGTALAATSDIPVGGGKVFADKKVVVTQPTAGEFKAFTAVCTHMGCTVGSVSGGTINCPCHGSAFHIADGTVAKGPAPSPLSAETIAVANGKITLS